jgi:hypothetical protein
MRHASGRRRGGKRIKEVLERCAATMDLEDAKQLRKASTHWLSTRIALMHSTAAGRQRVPIQVVQNNLGHASIGTTSGYLTTERDARLAAMKSFGDKVAAGEPQVEAGSKSSHRSGFLPGNPGLAPMSVRLAVTSNVRESASSSTNQKWEQNVAPSGSTKSRALPPARGVVRRGRQPHRVARNAVPGGQHGARRSVLADWRIHQRKVERCRVGEGVVDRLAEHLTRTVPVCAASRRKNLWPCAVSSRLTGGTETLTTCEICRGPTT